MEADFLLTTDKNLWGDISFTPDGDIQAVSGAALVAQDVRNRALANPATQALGARTATQALAASRGSLFYAPDYGEGLVDTLRGGGSAGAASTADTVVQKLREAAFRDERIDWESVEAGVYGEGKYYLKFGVLEAGAAQTVLLERAP